MRRTQHIRLLFEQALELDAEDRAAFLDEACLEDPSLRAEVEELIQADEAAGSFLGGKDGPADGLEEIGGFVLKGTLGEGGFGVVFRAEQSEPIRREVALKLIRLGMDSRAVLARFEAERQALARMSHPNVAQVLDAGVTESGRPYFVMELVDGLPLNEYVDRKALPLEERLRLFVEIARGVQHAHQKGLIHRDLKPSNVIVTEREGTPLPKIIDFGIAKAVHDPLTDHTLTTAQGFVGTPAYMAPEQALAAADIDTRADIYSLGVVLYELVTGIAPFERMATPQGGLPELLRRIAEVDPPRPSTRVARAGDTAAGKRPERPPALARALRGDIDWIVMHALEKEPDRRYPSAGALADDVERHLRHEPVSAGPPSATYRVMKFARRNRLAVGAAAALVLALALGGSSTLAEKRRADVHAAEARFERNHVLRLSAFQKLDDLQRAADELWPADAYMIEEYEEWLREAAKLVAGLEPDPSAHDLGHYGMLRQLELRGEPGDPIEQGDGAEGELVFPDDEDRWWHGQLVRLVDSIEAFADPDRGLIAGLGPPHGWGVERRLAFAREVGSRTLESEEAKARWSEAVADIAASSHYAGLELTPQHGLLPLGPNPESGLYEFWHVQSGSEPTRQASGALRVDESDGIVLVLIPGGTFTMGAQAQDPDGLNYDPLAAGEEGPLTELTLAPFFLAKYELTQGQWQRFAGANPSNYGAGSVFANREVGLANPVEQISWDEAERALSRMELCLPTQAQWEYATRAGSEAPWWTGPEVAWLEGAANVRDAYVAEMGVSWHPVDDELHDGHVVHARVGTFAPNPFGLHDVHGNVWEWCQDWIDSYADGHFEEGTGLHVADDRISRVYRGGSFFQQARDTRASFREGFTPDSAYNNLGVRAARPIRP